MQTRTMVNDSTQRSGGSDRESTNSEMTKPNCTIKRRHDGLLDELAETRHASRSEALRTAIEDYAQSVSNEGDTVVEQLFARVDALSDRVEELNEKLDALDAGSMRDTTLVESRTSAQPPGTEPVAEAVEHSSSDDKKGLQDDVYSVLNQQGPLSVSEIAEHISESAVTVHEVLKHLLDREFVTCTEQSDTRKYQIQPLNRE